MVLGIASVGTEENWRASAQNTSMLVVGEALDGTSILVVREVLAGTSMLVVREALA